MNKQHLLSFVNGIIKSYDDKRFWRYKISLHDMKQNSIIKAFRLLYLVRCEAKNCASLGNRLNGGSYFESAPFLPHGIRGIYITDHARIGRNVTIFQDVTIGVKHLGDKEGPVIGDNCVICTGAKIIGNVKIGNNCIIGPGVVVWFDIPDNSKVVVNKPRIIRLPRKLINP